MLPLSRTAATHDLSPPLAPAGQLDCRFGVMGRTTAEYPHFGGAASESIAYASALDGCGRLLIAGHSFDARGKLVASIARFRDNGTLDPGFGIRGFVTLPTTVQGGSAWLRLLAVAPDGRIFVGFDVKGDERRHVRLCRLLPDGLLDSEFLDNGAGDLQFSPCSSIDTLRGLAIQRDGNVVLLATTHLTEVHGPMLALLRVTPDGTADARFGGSIEAGLRLIQFAEHLTRRRPWRLVLGRDDGILVGGDLVADGDEGQIGLALLRFSAQGQLDTSFGEKGRVLLQHTRNDQLRELLVREDGRIVVIAQTADGSDMAVSKCLQRLPNGRPDAAFGHGGEIRTALGARARCQRPQAACLQRDGKLLLVGTPWAEQGGQRVTLTRLQLDGERDLSFGEDGYAPCGFVSEFESTASVSVDSVTGVHLFDDRIVVAGHMLEQEMKYKFSAVALQA